MYRKLGVREQAFYRSRSEYEGLKLDQGRRLKQRERENAAGGGPELASDKLILKETAGTASTGSAPGTDCLAAGISDLRAATLDATVPGRDSGR